MRSPRPLPSLVLFASGTGSNVRAIVSYNLQKPFCRIGGIVCNRKAAPVLAFAREAGIPCLYLPAAEWEDADALLDWLSVKEADLLVLAGFLLKVPDAVLEAYPDRILNIHPALLPAYGGPGMYGDRVHQAVLEAGESRSGITVHLVNSEYDRGRILFQAATDIRGLDTPEALRERIHSLEHLYFPGVVESYLQTLHL